MLWTIQDSTITGAFVLALGIIIGIIIKEWME